MMRKVKTYCIGFWVLVLMLIEWTADMLQKVVTVVHGSIKDLALAVEKQYLKAKDEPDSGKSKD